MVKILKLKKLYSNLELHRALSAKSNTNNDNNDYNDDVDDDMMDADKIIDGDDFLKKIDSDIVNDDDSNGNKDDDNTDDNDDDDNEFEDDEEIMENESDDYSDEEYFNWNAAGIMQFSDINLVDDNILSGFDNQITYNFTNIDEY